MISILDSALVSTYLRGLPLWMAQDPDHSEGACVLHDQQRARGHEATSELNFLTKVLSLELTGPMIKHYKAQGRVKREAGL